MFFSFISTSLCFNKQIVYTDNYQPQTCPQPQRQTEPLQHRPDTPVDQRRSPPEIVSKVRQAIEEMTSLPNREVPPGDHTLINIQIP